MTGKRYAAAVAARPSERLSLEQSVSFIKEHATAKFDETIEVHIRLGVDPKKSDQVVRGTVQLPHGSPRVTRVAVFAEDPAAADAAKTAGADIVGGLELIEDIRQKGDLAADVAVATPGIMKDLAKIAKILGPRGLMPNPRSNTIGTDPADIVRSVKGGAITFKTDAGGNVHIAVAKSSWDADTITENIHAVLDGIRSARPSGVKGEFIQNISVSSTMGPGVDVRF